MIVRIFWLMQTLLLCLSATSQLTSGSVAGRVIDDRNSPLPGAAIRCSQRTTGTMYFAVTGKNGYFSIPNLPPGGSYVIEASFVNHTTQQQADVTVNLGNETHVQLLLPRAQTILKQVTVSTRKRVGFTNRPTGVLTSEKLEWLPGTELYEHLRSFPFARLQEGNEGALSFAGQNNRFNALYVDGAINNDVFGLSASGTNGGQAAVSLLPAEAIAQYQVALTPFDAAIGNFTGAAVHAVTRSGTNRREGSVYQYFSNHHMRGRSDALERTSQTTPSFFTRTYGMRLQGPFVPDRLFYFVNMELQRDLFSQPFDYGAYTGNSKDKRLPDILANTVRGTYRYDPGEYLNNPEQVNVDRVLVRMDWNPNGRNSISLSGRYTYAQRIHTNASEPETIHFSNDGYALLSGTLSTSAEWKSRLGKRSYNSLLVTFTRTKDDREPLHRPFPRVRINDGNGAFVFGTDNSSMINLLTQHNWSLIDKMRITWGSHTVTFGVEMEHSAIYNAFIQNSFGSYTYASPADFLTNARPSAYQRSFSLTDQRNDDQTNAAARFSMLRMAWFVNDEHRANRVSLQWGIRIDKHLFPVVPVTSNYINSIAIPEYRKYWDVADAQPGSKIRVPVNISPRLGFSYRSDRRLTIRGGAGLFAGRIPLAWPGGVYTNNGVNVGGFSAGAAQLQKIRFVADPYRQWSPKDFGISGNKEPLNLLSGKFSMPSVWRLSLALEKEWGNWTAELEWMYTKNRTEIKYTNVNLVPPVAHAQGADNRYVFALSPGSRIALNPDGSNPFDYAILLSNNNRQTGYAFDGNLVLKGPLGRGWHFDGGYHFGRSFVNQEGTSSVNLTQWRTMETVNGRNFLVRSESDFSMGHRVFAVINRRYKMERGAWLDVSFAYNGESGSSISYVYDGSMTRDDGPFGTYDLIYIPTVRDLEQMIFLPNTVNGISYSPESQKTALNRFIENDGYLRRHRGEYAARNGSRLPFTHVVDLRIRYTIELRRRASARVPTRSKNTVQQTYIPKTTSQPIGLAHGKQETEQNFPGKWATTTLGSSGKYDPGTKDPPQPVSAPDPGSTSFRAVGPPARGCQLQLTYDLFNFTNLLSGRWGARYLQPADHVPLIEFAGYTGPDGLTPQFRFDPGRLNKEKWQVSTSPKPAYSALWTGRIGVKLVF